ncbi:MAG: universal stress protein [Rhodobacteraceae bacterium]|nr:universal stress protein [Paracoccaceae bacterium]
MYKKIFVPIDVNQESSWRGALPTAIEFAKKDGAKLYLFTVVPDFGMAMVGSFFPKDYAEKAMVHAEHELKAVARNNVPSDIDCTCYVRHGTIYKRIIKSANELGADLIVLTSHRPETKDYLLGPNAARVVRHASQSVFVIRE